MKITVDFSLLCQVIPEASIIPFLPRKRKKKMKKEITKKLVDLALDYVNNKEI